MRAVGLQLVIVLGGAACSDPAAPPPDAEVLPTQMPARLSQTGLYKDIRTKELAANTVEFTIQHALWSDAAQKHRWIQLPPGTQIDTTDIDHWKFPVGTKFFKEFDLDGKRLETRLVWHVADTGVRESDTLLGAFVWNDAETEATFVKDGAENLRGTMHDAPAADTCWRCHVGEAGHILGFSALQLGEVSSLPLSAPPPAGATYNSPNDALGWLHANCGHCHNPNGGAWVDSHLVLRLDVAERDAATTQTYLSTVGVPLEQWIGHGYTYRIVAGDPDASELYYRISQRGPNVQMPPLATEIVDDVDVAMVRAWIQSL